MTHLPLPVRLAAGLAATAVEQVRELPRLIVELPVTAVSQALQTSMRLQQRVTDLAIKGDRVLGTLRLTEERPSWARFDDEEEPVVTRNGSVLTLHADDPGPRGGDIDSDDPSPGDGFDRTGADRTGDSGSPGAKARTADAPVSDAPAVAAAATRAAAQHDGPQPTPTEPPATAGTPAAQATEVDGPNALPGYDQLSIPQLRAKLRVLSVDDLRALLAWEESHRNRPPFLTMLDNRITTVTEG